MTAAPDVVRHKQAPMGIDPGQNIIRPIPVERPRMKRWVGVSVVFDRCLDQPITLLPLSIKSGRARFNMVMDE